MDTPQLPRVNASFDEQLRRFGAQIDSARKRTSALHFDTWHNREALSEALEELDVTLEELSNAQEELRAQNEALVEARDRTEIECQRYEQLYAFAPDGYLVTDVNGVIQEANQAAARLLGVRAQAVIGKPLALYFSAEMRQVFRSRLSALQEAEWNVEWEAILQSRDGVKFPAALTVAVARDPAGHVAGLRWLIRDITERKRTEAVILDHVRRLDAAGAALQAERDLLEQRVEERTQELTEANGQIQEELIERRRVEDQITGHQREIEALNSHLQRAMVETHHRVKNNLQADQQRDQTRRRTHRYTIQR